MGVRMPDLSHLSLRELDATELREIDGGCDEPGDTSLVCPVCRWLMDILYPPQQ